MARYKRFYIPSRGLSRIGGESGANRVPVTPPGDHTPNPGGRTPNPGSGMSPIGGDGYTPGDRPIGDNSSPDFPDWLAGIGESASSCCIFSFSKPFAIATVQIPSRRDSDVLKTVYTLFLFNTVNHN